MQGGAWIEPYEGVWPDTSRAALVHPRAVVIGRVTLGEDASVWPNATLRGDEGELRIGPRTNLQDGVTVHTTHGLSTVVVGADVTVGHHALLHGCRVEDGCLIGMGAILLDNCVIGAGSLIGAGALVLAGKVIPPGSVVLGNPGKIVRTVTEAERLAFLDSARRYVEKARRYALERGLNQP